MKITFNIKKNENELEKVILDSENQDTTVEVLEGAFIVGNLNEDECDEKCYIYNKKELEDSGVSLTDLEINEIITDDEKLFLKEFNNFCKSFKYIHNFYNDIFLNEKHYLGKTGIKQN